MKGWMGLAIIMSLGLANLAVAADWSLVPSVTQQSEFNSNINLTLIKARSATTFLP